MWVQSGCSVVRSVPAFWRACWCECAGSLCYFANVSKIGQNPLLLSACLLCLWCVGFEYGFIWLSVGFLAWFGGFVWVCVVLVLCVALCACRVRRIKDLLRVCLRFSLFLCVCPAFVLLLSFCPSLVWLPFVSPCLSSCFPCGSLCFPFPLRTIRKEERAQILASSLVLL